MRFEVHGTPAPKGSARAIMRGGRPQLVPGSSNVNRDAQRHWVAEVRKAARNVRALRGVVWVSIEFRLARPRSHFGTGKNEGRLKRSAPAYPGVKPDVDKLARCTLDALTELAFEDDARIVNLHVGKEYATAAAPEGAVITIGRWPIVTRRAELNLEGAAA